MKNWKGLLNELIEADFEIISYRRYRVEKDGKVLFPSLITAAHKDKKMLLTATSYVPTEGPEDIGAVHIYGTLDPHSPASWLRYVTCQSESEDDSVIYFSINRDDAINMIPFVERQGTLINWRGYGGFARFMTNPEDEGNLWEEFLENSPNWVQAFIR